MNLKEEKYTKFSLAKEMLETVDVIARFNPGIGKTLVEKTQSVKKIFFTGEGSSRIFPAKRAIYDAMRQGVDLSLHTDGSTQALEYDLRNSVVFGASNSGKTKELVRLFNKLKNAGHKKMFGVTAFANSKISEYTEHTHVLSCGKEDAVAATKSVVEQALVYHSYFAALSGKVLSGLDKAAKQVETALTLAIDSDLVKKVVDSHIIYFAGRNNGVAEELTLKTNEITRKKSGYLEGTYAVHGIEEVMDKNETVIIIDPFVDEEEKFSECLEKGVGMNVIAIASRKTRFPTVIIPDGEEFRNYVELAAGWNLLMEIGLAAGVNLDKPQRARKIGNEFVG